MRGFQAQPVILKWIAIVILAGRWLDLYLAVMPTSRSLPACDRSTWSSSPAMPGVLPDGDTGAGECPLSR